MSNSWLFYNPRFLRVAAITGILIVLLLLGNIPAVGGEHFFENSTTLLSPVAALVASLLFFKAAANRKDSASRRIWLGMAAGFGLWGLADVIWACYALLRQDTPTLSLADLPWSLGYLPLFLALWTRFSTLKVKPTRRQYWLIAGASLGWFALAAFFVFRPILADFDPARWLEGAVNIFYPLGDLVLVIVSSYILLLLQEGRFAISWRLIFIGILIMSCSDLLYCYALWQGLYYPDGVLNAISFLADTTYILAYLSVAFGIFIYGLVWEIKESYVLSVEIAPSAKYYAYIGTDSDNQILLASDNFYYLVNERSDRSFFKLPLAQALRAHPAEFQRILAKIRDEGLICHEPFEITTLNLQGREVWLTAFANFDTAHRFTGTNLAISADIDVPPDLRLPKSQEVQGMLRYLLSLAGSRPKDDIQTMRAYFLETIQLHSTMLYQFGGTQFKNALFAELDKTIHDMNLPVELNERAILIPDVSEGAALAGALIPLLQTAQRFVAGMVGEQMVWEEVAGLEMQLSETTLRSLDKYHLRNVRGLG